MKYFIIICNLFVSIVLHAQVGLGTTSPHPSAILELQSKDKGFKLPTMSSFQIRNIINPAIGLMAYSITDNCLYNYNGNHWINLCTNDTLERIVPFTPTSDTRIKANNISIQDQFGFSVAMSSDGKTLIVGAPFEDSDLSGDNNNIDNSGAVYIYRLNGDTWSEGVRIKANNPGADDNFGNAVSISDDGKRIAVAAFLEDSDNSGNDNDLMESSGAVYVYDFDGSDWNFISRLKANDADENDQFGFSIALSGDGKVLAVGSPFEGSNTGVNNNLKSGAAYLYTYTNSWDTGVRIKSQNPDAGEEFGSSVSLSKKGAVLVVGIPFQNSDGSTTNNNLALQSGSAMVYRFNGNNWMFETQLKANNIGAYDFFGYRSVVSGDGKTIVIGADGEDSDASGDDNNSLNNSGALYVYRYTGSNWVFQKRLKANNAGSADRLGRAISVSTNGNTILVGAAFEDSDISGSDNNNFGASGASYVYRFGESNWNTGKRLKANNAGNNDRFGYAVSLNGEGNIAVVGAFLEASNAPNVDNNAAINSGAVYIIKE